MNVIDEWLDSEGAQRDAIKFMNGCYIISGRRCGKTATMTNDIFERLKNQKAPNIRYLRQKFDDVDATNAIKEFINKQYGIYSSFGRAVPDICWPTVEQIREEFMMDLLYEGYVRVIDHGLVNDGIVDMYVRVFANCDDRNNVKFNFYRSSDIHPTYTVKFANPTWNEVEVCNRCREVTNNKLVWQLLINPNRDFLAMCEKKYDIFYKNTYKSVKNFGAGTYITDEAGAYYCVAECYLNPERRDGYIKAHLKAFKKPNLIDMDTWARIIKRYSKEHIQQGYGMEETTLNYYIYDDGNVEIPFFKFVEDNNYPNKAKLITDRVDMDNMDISKEMEMLNKNYKKEKERTEMKGYKFMVPKGAFGSKVYIQAKDSDKITYAGTLTDMHLETASGCEMHGNIDFIADDEPVEKLAGIDRGFIKNVVFNDPATIVEWKDGSKTVVKTQDGEHYDPEKGLAMAISKKAMGNKRDYYHVFKHYLKKVSKDTKKK